MLLQALPYGTKRIDVPLTREVLELACSIDAKTVVRHFLGTEDEWKLRRELERVEAQGGTADFLGPLERFLRKVAAGDLQVLFRDSAPILLRAVLDGEVDEVAKLLEAGENPNTPTLGRTPLAFAVESGNIQIIRLLLRAGATADGAEVERIFETLVLCDLATADALELAQWLAEHPLFDVDSECHATTQTLLSWAEMVGAKEVIESLRQRRGAE